MSIGIAYNPCKNCQEMDKCSICELTYYRKGYIKSPTADVVEVRHGEWKYNEGGGYVCSECNCWLEDYYGATPEMMNYCFKCGAKMDGERREG